MNALKRTYTRIARAAFSKGRAIQREEWFDLCRANPPNRDVAAEPFEAGATIVVPAYESPRHVDPEPFARRLASRRYISDVDADDRTATAGADVAALLTVYWYHEQNGGGAEEMMDMWASRPVSGIPEFWPVVRKQYRALQSAEHVDEALAEVET